MSEAMQQRPGQMPAWLVFSGVAIGVGGASVNKHAESVGELVVALGGRTNIPDVAVAVALGHWALVVLLAGAVVVLAGLAVIALAGQSRRWRCARDRGRCSAACRGLTQLPPCPEPSRRASSARAA
jgi:NaMN:DMB phosphoribosyltransferase